jgi:peptidoglycan/xylan/chitin deacetylase (PgdA/CDA1 family)
MENEITILLYHGVTEHENFGITNHANKHLNVNDFSEQMEWLSSNANLVSMDEVTEMFIKNIPFPEKSVAVTFDDGYKNNFTTAMPILDKNNIPTTFYIAAGMIGQKDLFWVDKIEACIEKTSKKDIEIKLGKDHVTYNLEHHESRLHALYSIKKYCKLTSQTEVDHIIEDLIRATELNHQSKMIQIMKL